MIGRDEGLKEREVTENVAKALFLEYFNIVGLHLYFLEIFIFKLSNTYVGIER